MAHNHPVTDIDTHFKIDGATRLVKNVSDTKTMLVQYDHKSERFTFEVDRKPDEHDLSLCNRVRVHYINIEKSKRTENKGVCPITDTLQIHSEDDSLVTCSWLVPKEATLLVGSLHFVIEFACIEGNELLYSWNTARHTAVSIAEGIDGGEEVINANIDILTKWENDIKDNLIVSLEQTTISTEDNGENIWTATFGNGTTQELKVRNGSKGDTGLIGSIETVQGNPLHFFVGTQAEYDALSDDKKQNLFAIITDETPSEALFEALEPLINGSTPVRYAEQVKSTMVDLGGYSDSRGIDVVLNMNTTYIFFESEEGNTERGYTYILHVGDKNAGSDSGKFKYRSSTSPTYDGTSEEPLFALEYKNTENAVSYGTLYKVYCGGLSGTKSTVGNLKYIKLAYGAV